MSTDVKAKMTDAQIADAWAKYTIEKWGKKIHKLNIDSVGPLIESFTHDLSTGVKRDILKVTFTFKQYGTFVDMGVGRGSKIGDVKTNAFQRRMVGKMIGNRRRPKKWYSKTMRNQELRLYEILAEKYGQAVVDLIINDLINIVE